MSAEEALAAARAGLRLSAIPKSMPCRDEERDRIGHFVADALRAYSAAAAALPAVAVDGATVSVVAPAAGVTATGTRSSLR